MSVVAIIGASRGIGLGLLEAYAADGWETHGTVRDSKAAGAAAHVAGDVFVHELEVRDQSGLMRLRHELPELDVLIHNAGISANGVDEQTLQAVNVDAPITVIEALLPRVRDDGRVVIMSSLMGSRGSHGRRLSPYGESKARLNERFRAVCGNWTPTAVVMHPGWVRTDMGGSGAPLSVAQSVAGIRRVVAALRPAQHGAFLNHDGTAIPW